MHNRDAVRLDQGNDWSSRSGKSSELSDTIGSEILEMSPDNFRVAACPPRLLPVHERLMRIGERQQSLPLPQENSGLHQRRSRRSASTAVRFRISSESRSGSRYGSTNRGCRIGNTRPSIGNIHFFSHPNRCMAPSGFGAARHPLGPASCLRNPVRCCHSRFAVSEGQEDKSMSKLQAKRFSRFGPKGSVWNR